MNILLLTHEGNIAGSTNSISFLAKGLADRGHSVYLGCKKESHLYSKLQNQNVHLIPMKFKGRFDLSNIRHVAEIVKEHQIQIINAQSSLDRYSSMYARWFYGLDVKVIHTRRQPPLSAGGWIQRQLYIKGTDAIVVVSDQMEQILIKSGYPPEHLKVIYNGIPVRNFSNPDIEKVKALRRELGISENDRVIGCVSRMKKQYQLIKALKYCDPSVKVLFVGIPKGSLDELAAKEGIKNELLYAGIVDTKSVVDYYHLFTIDILCSTTDGFGLVLVESMASGVPVIGTKWAGIADVIQDGVSGLLYENENHRQLSECINSLLNDSESRKRLINGGYARAQHFSIDSTIDNYELFFKGLLK